MCFLCVYIFQLTIIQMSLTMISFLFLGASLPTAFIAIVGTLVVFMPVIIRLSRNIWINFFVKYDPSSVKKHEAVAKS